jgi:hypothetical protein
VANPSRWQIQVGEKSKSAASAHDQTFGEASHL